MQYDEKTLQIARERRLLIDEYDSWIVEEIRPFLGQRIFEIGCGLGNLLKHFVDQELIIGIEPTSKTVAEVKQRFTNYNNMSIYKFSITDPSVLSLQEMEFDSAISLNVFEHIEDDELATRHTALLLKPGGHYIEIVPAHQWLFGTMDTSIGHYRRYTKALARSRMEKSGLIVKHQKYMNTLGAIGWLINGRLFKLTVAPTRQLRIFNKLVPFLKATERAFPPPFGLSLLTVAQLNAEAR